MKRLFLLLALVGMIATSCQESGIEEPSSPIEQPDDNDNKDEEQPGDEDNKDNEEQSVFEIVGPGNYTIGAEGGSVEVVVRTNFEYRLEVSQSARSWLTIADTRAVRTERLTINVAPNNSNKERTATISVYDSSDFKFFVFTLTQDYATLDDEDQPSDDEEEDEEDEEENDDTDVPVECANNEILYTTKDGYPIKLYFSTGFGGNIMSHTYENGLGRIVFDSDVTTIPNHAFYHCNDSIVTVTLPNCVTTIGESAFDQCSNLKSIAIPDNVIKIGSEAFDGCESLTSVTIGNSVAEIGGSAFNRCRSLKCITIPDSVTTIGYGAFADCGSLTSVTIADSVISIGKWAFTRCSNLIGFKGAGASSDGLCVVNNQGALLYFLGKDLTEYIIPDGVTIIGEEVFHGCSSLTSVTIPDSVTTIGDRAFHDCSSLTSVYISDIAAWCNISFAISSSPLFYYADLYLNNEVITELIIPDSVTTIGEWVFWRCGSLTSVTIPDSVTSIGEHAFSNCSSLTSVTIPDSITMIGEGAFWRCYSLKNATIPDSVIEIGGLAFEGCSNLISVTIPSSVTSIGDYTFHKCSSLTSVYCKATTPPTAVYNVYGHWDAFDKNADARRIYVPAASAQAYRSSKGWSGYTSAIIGYDFE